MDAVLEDPTLTALRSVLSQMKEKDPMAARAIEEGLKIYEENKTIDLTLLERLQELAAVHKTPLVRGHDYDKLLEMIDEHSVIVYFKSAKAFKVYKSSQIKSDLHNHINNDFRRNKNMYEVIPDNVPQKILIICEKEIAKHIDVFKKYIIEFMHTKKIEIKMSNIKAFQSDSGMIEIMINGYYVSNYKESVQIISELMKYIEKKERNAEITKRMNARVFNEYEGTHMASMPNNKVSMDGEKWNL